MILFLFIAVITALILERISLSLPVRNVRYQRGASVRGAEQGEEFRIVTTIENRTNRKIPYLRLEEPLPGGIRLCDAQQLDFCTRDGVSLHRSTLFVRKRERVRRSVRAVSYARGMHYFQGSALYFGDFLGIREIASKEEAQGSVLIYPRRIASERLTQAVNDIMGELSVQSFLYEDPLLVRGYRDYTGREPLRAVNFLQSAKRAQLMVKEFDRTRTPMANIVLDMEFYGEFEHYFDQREAQLSVARAICERLEGRGTGYRIITNMCYPSMQVRGVNVIESEGNGAGFQKILEILSVASCAAICTTDVLLSYAAERFASGETFLYIAQRPCAELEERLSGWRARGAGEIRTFYGSEYEECYRAAGAPQGQDGKEGAA